MTGKESKAEDALARLLAIAYARAKRVSKFSPMATDLVEADEKILRQFMFGEDGNKEG